MTMYMYEKSIASRCGHDLIYGGGFRAPKDTWMTITQYVKMNDPGTPQP
jgi:hypothetical protein